MGTISNCVLILLRCKLEASISLTDNFGNTTNEVFNLYVPVSFQFMNMMPMFSFGGDTVADITGFVGNPIEQFEHQAAGNAALAGQIIESGGSVGGFGGGMFLLNP